MNVNSYFLQPVQSTWAIGPIYTVYLARTEHYPSHAEHAVSSVFTKHNLQMHGLCGLLTVLHIPSLGTLCYLSIAWHITVPLTQCQTIIKLQ